MIEGMMKGEKVEVVFLRVGLREEEVGGAGWFLQRIENRERVRG